MFDILKGENRFVSLSKLAYYANSIHSEAALHAVGCARVECGFSIQNSEVNNV
jgi:hypothetical protein